MKVVWQDEIELYLYCQIEILQQTLYFKDSFDNFISLETKTNKLKNKLKKEMPTGIPRSIDQPKNERKLKLKIETQIKKIKKVYFKKFKNTKRIFFIYIFIFCLSKKTTVFYLFQIFVLLLNSFFHSCFSFFIEC